MIKNEIYYLCDQFGPKFIKIFDQDNDWVFYYKSTKLFDIVNQINCNRSQIKRWNFDKLLNIFSYNGFFKGCIKLDNNIVNIITGSATARLSESINKSLIVNCEFIEYKNHEIICKKISKDDFRNLKLNKILIN